MARTRRYTVVTIDPNTQWTKSRLGRLVGLREAHKIADLWESHGTENVCVIDDRGVIVRQPSTTAAKRNRSGIKLVRISDKNPAEMTPSQINNELDRLGTARSKMIEEFISAGRGSETYEETARLNDPLARNANAVSDRMSALHHEINRRTGAGNIYSRMPRGFGPIRGT